MEHNCTCKTLYHIWHLSGFECELYILQVICRELNDVKFYYVSDDKDVAAMRVFIIMGVWVSFYVLVMCIVMVLYIMHSLLHAETCVKIFQILHNPVVVVYCSEAYIIPVSQCILNKLKCGVFIAFRSFKNSLNMWCIHCF